MNGEIKIDNDSSYVEMLKIVVNRLNSDVNVLHRLIHKDFICDEHCEIMMNQLIIPTIPKEVADWIKDYDKKKEDITNIAIQYILEDFVESDAYRIVKGNVSKYGAYDTLLHNAIRYGYRIEGE